MTYKVDPGKEGQEVELAALIMLKEGLGYDYLTNDELNQIRPGSDIRDVVLFSILKKQLPILNPWMKNHPEVVDSAIEELKRVTQNNAQNHTDANEIIHAMYTEMSIDNLQPLKVLFDSGHGEESKTVHLFNFKDPEKNNFLVSNQVRISKYRDKFEPDIIIFVNGFPLVVIECKSPAILNPANSAIEDNLKRYQVSDTGADKLSFYNLFLVATGGDYAKHGCIQENVDANFYARWSSTYPYTDEEVEKLAQRKPREQEKLIAGMLNKKNLINILEIMVIFDKVDGKNIKKIAKHQQLRAVLKSVERLEITIKTASNLGGTIWHSQGSGKSLTMFWLAKQIRRNFKTEYPILVVTDRTSLDNQIHINFKGAGWNNPIRVKNSDELVEELRSPEKKVIMTTIHKLGLKKNPDILTDKTVIILTDESHRSEFGEAATRMRNALPNGIFFAFTATPIDKGFRKVFQKFGEPIDNYTWAESREDGTTVGIEILPRYFPIDVDAKLLTEEFDKEFAGFSKLQKAQIKRDQVKMNKLRRATKRIQEIAEHIVQDFHSRVEIEGFKAMIVADGREAAVRYKKALDAIEGAPKSIVIMTSNSDDVGIEGDSWAEFHYSNKGREQKSKEFTKSDDENQILIVSDMLLTGYDAPIIQTMYLDKRLTEHTLLQAIARVNRKYKSKQHGVIVDYRNIAKELEYAKNMFDANETRDMTFDKDSLIANLKNTWKTVMVDVKGVDPENKNQVLERFSDEAKQDLFYTNYKDFEKALDSVMPDAAANEFLDDFARLTIAKTHIMNLLNQNKFSTAAYSNKIQKMLDKFVSTGKINIPIRKLDYDDERFGIEIKKLTSKRAQNAATTGRLGSTISIHRPDNPVFYDSLEEQLNEILRLEATKQLDAESVFRKLTDLLDESKKESQIRTELGFENGFEFAIYGELKNIIKDEKISIDSSIAIFKKMEPLIEYVDWTKNINVKKNMEKLIYEILTENNFPEDAVDKLSEDIIDLAMRNLNER